MNVQIPKRILVMVKALFVFFVWCSAACAQSTQPVPLTVLSSAPKAMEAQGEKYRGEFALDEEAKVSQITATKVGMVFAALTTALSAATLAIIFWSVKMSRSSLELLSKSIRLTNENIKLTKEATELNRACKKVDVLIECNRRFMEIAKIGASANTKDEKEIYYGEFWSLQYDQFNYWRMGFIDDRTLVYWLSARRDERETETKLRSTSLLESWTNHRAFHQDDDFKKCMDMVLAEEITIEEILVSIRKRPSFNI